MSCSHSLHTLPLVHVYLLSPAFNPHVPQGFFFPCSHVHVQNESQPLQINTDQQKNPIDAHADCDSTTQPDYRSLLFLPASPLLSSQPGVINATGSQIIVIHIFSCLRTAFGGGHNMVGKHRKICGTDTPRQRGDRRRAEVCILFASVDL